LQFFAKIKNKRFLKFITYPVVTGCFKFETQSCAIWSSTIYHFNIWKIPITSGEKIRNFKKWVFILFLAYLKR